MARRLARLVLVSLPLLAGAVPSDRELEGIKKKIESERRGLSQLGAKESSTLDSLGKIQSDLEKRSKEIKLANARLSSISGELRAKHAEAERLAESAAARLELFEKRAAALYRWQRSGSPLMIFDGDGSLSSFLRRRHYLTLALSYDQELLAKIADEAKEHDLVRQELADKQEELAEQKQIIGTAREEIRREAQKKQLLLASLRREKQTRLRALQQMEAAARRLEKMLDEIARRAAIKPRDLPSAPSPGSGLAALRGRLEWPVRGQISAPFGKFKHPEFSAEIVRKGIDIEAALGEEVRAVERGQVVYAEQFSGYGKMVIVDHGERYYTIYGHLSEISKKKGDRINRGEILGRAGEGDSSTTAKLYFEMRKDGHSLDPVPWFGKH
jgi:septal ring factor EnvC (AmiA/AmiB activator)